MSRPQTIRHELGTIFGTVSAVARHGRGAHEGQRVPGGTLMDDAASYDAHSRLLFGSLFRAIASDVATVAEAVAGAVEGAEGPDGARVLEVGCGPGHLSVLLARRHGLDVTGVDLDPAMIGRARANAGTMGTGDEVRPSFLVGDAASLPFEDGSFDLVVSTLSMHHWADPTAGLAEIGRVLRSDGRALVWDFRQGVPSFHARDMPDPVERARDSSLRVVSTKPWRWPWRFTLIRRTELTRANDARTLLPDPRRVGP